MLCKSLTAGTVSGTLNFQVFPLGVGADQVQLSIDFDGAGEYGGGPVSGCMDATACNFNGAAVEDDGSCDYSCYGCVDVVACNYDAYCNY